MRELILHPCSYSESIFGKKTTWKINLISSSAPQMKSRYIGLCCAHACAPALQSLWAPGFSRSHGHWLMQNACSTVIESDRVLTDEDIRTRAELNERTKSTALFCSLCSLLFVAIDGCQTIGLVLLSEKNTHGHKQMHSTFFLLLFRLDKHCRMLWHSFEKRH